MHCLAIPMTLTLTVLLCVRPSSPSNLTCYECDESFGARWDKHTDCQIRPTYLHTVSCGADHRYCKVERLEWKRRTLRMSRGCATWCREGCRAEGIAVTKLRCQSCCTKCYCNVGNRGTKLRVWSNMPFLLFIVVVGL